MTGNKAVAYMGSGKVEVHDTDYPGLELRDGPGVNPANVGRKTPHGVILKNVATNICGSDQHMVRGRTTAPTGLVLGHEITGEVVEKGPDVEFIQVGDLCSVPFNISCGRCRNCKAGQTGICLNVNPDRPGSAYGYVDMGGWVGGQAQYVMVPYADWNLLRFPDRDQAMAKILDLAMLSDIFPTGYHGCVTAGVDVAPSSFYCPARRLRLAAAEPFQAGERSRLNTPNRRDPAQDGMGNALECGRASVERIVRRRRRVGALSLGRSPLRREVDRIEASIFAGLLAAFLIGAPLLAIAAGRWEHSAAAAEQRAQQSVHLVTAVLLQDVPDIAVGDGTWDAGALARWTASDGKSFVGDILDTAGAPAGSRVQIWVDGSGRQTYPPLTRRGLETRVITAAALAPAAFAITLLTVALCLRWLLNRRRLAGWGASWADIGPRWTRRG